MLFYSKKILALVVFFTSILVFLIFALLVSSELSETNKILDLAADKKIVLLKNWRVSIDSCFGNTRDNCLESDLVIEDTLINDRDLIGKWLNTIRLKYKNHQHHPDYFLVHLEHKLSFSALSWLQSNPQSSLVMPELVGTNVRMVSPITTHWLVSSSADFKITLPQSIQKKPMISIQLLVDKDQKWFGLTNLHAALTNWQYLEQYSNIDQIDTVVYYLQRSSLVIFPLIVSSLSLILDHVKVVLGLSYLSLIIGLRVLLASLFELSDFNTQGILALLILLLYSLTPLAIFRLVMMTFNFSIKHRYELGALAGILVINHILYFLDDTKLYIEKAHFWTDIAGCIIAIVICGYCVFDNYRNKKLADVDNNQTNDTNKNIGLNSISILKPSFDNTDKQNNHCVIHKPSLIIMMMIIFLSVLCANIWDYLAFFYNLDTVVSSWIHQLFIPGLFLIALINIGSIVNTIKRVTKIVEEKTKIDRDIEIGKELQSGILPDKKSFTDKYRWHAFYYPASHLAGDWFDLREIKTANNKSLLLGCIVDVTGHGISSAMMTSNIASHWGLWCNSVLELKLGDQIEDYHRLLESVPYQIHRGLIGLRYNLGCSMAVLMYEPDSRNFLYLTAGHPGILLSSGNNFEYLTSVGTRPGINNGITKWKAKSMKLTKKHYTIAMFTDGLVQDGQALPIWLKHIRRKARSDNRSPNFYLTSQLRANRRFFVKNHQKEDDLTLLLLNIYQSQDCQDIDSAKEAG